jgi:hypothetical protein
VLVLNVLAFRHGCAVASSNTLLDVVNGNVTVRITYSDVVFPLLGVGTTDDTVIGLNVQLREGGVLEGVEAEQPVLELGVVNTVDIVFSIPDSN